MSDLYTNDKNRSYTYPDFMDGYESGSPIVNEVQNLKTLFAEEVIAKSFLFMFVALLITALASITTSINTVIFLFTGNSFFILMFLEIVIVIVSNVAISNNKPILAGVLYAIYSYLTGVILSAIFLVYTTASITAIFLITAGLFGVMAVYGLLTKNDLSSVGSICFMGLLGLIISGVVNLFFLKSTMLDTVICAIGVLVFVGLTAYDAQKIKARVESATDETVLTLALFGGFQLYLDFVNLFLKLLRLFGKKRR